MARAPGHDATKSYTASLGFPFFHPRTFSTLDFLALSLPHGNASGKLPLLQALTVFHDAEPTAGRCLPDAAFLTGSMHSPAAPSFPPTFQMKHKLARKSPPNAPPSLYRLFLVSKDESKRARMHTHRDRRRERTQSRFCNELGAR